jgi:hypothetical protein
VVETMLKTMVIIIAQRCGQRRALPPQLLVLTFQDAPRLVCCCAARLELGSGRSGEPRLACTARR